MKRPGRERFVGGFRGPEAPAAEGCSPEQPGRPLEASGNAGLSNESQGGMGSRGHVDLFARVLGPAVRLRAQQPANRRYRQLRLNGDQRTIGSYGHPGDAVAQRFDRRE